MFDKCNRLEFLLLTHALTVVHGERGGREKEERKNSIRYG